jgi:glycosyltransferase involved in cell wall biosynthesis
MKILILGTAYPLRGGIAHYNALLASALRNRHTVETITFKRQYPSLLFPGKTQEESGGGLHGEPAPQLIDSINPFNWWSVAREIRRRSPDLVIFKYWLPFFGPCFGTIARLVKRGRTTRILTICDNVLPHERRVFDLAFTRYAFAPVDYFIVQSDAVERDLLSFWPEAAYRNVPHPLYSMFGEAVPKDRARRELGLTADRVILFFGYIRKYKGLHVLLDAMASLDRTLGIHLVVAGEFYDDERSYREQIARLNLEQSVTIRSDYLPNESVALYFSAADAVILPYLSATQSGIAQIAFNFDRPVIATMVGGLSEVVRENVTGLLAPPADSLALRDRIVSFYADARERSLVEGVRAEKGRYSWDNLVRAIEELIHSKP